MMSGNRKNTSDTMGKVDSQRKALMHTGRSNVATAKAKRSNCLALIFLYRKKARDNAYGLVERNHEHSHQLKKEIDQQKWKIHT